MQFVELPTVDDIAYFVGANSRAENDSANRVREDILLSLYSDFPESHFTDETYGHIWTDIRNKFRKVIDSLCSEEFDSVMLEKKAGMSHNYDFVVKYIDANNVVIKELKLEFKNNNTSIDKLPQILELYDKDMGSDGKYKMTNYTYAEYYYDNYLDDYLETDNTITVEKPDLDVYLKNVRDIKYKHRFFRNLYEAKDNVDCKKEKQTIVDTSISSYLEDYAHTFDFTEVEKKLKNSQSDKTFLFWNGNDFVIDTVNVADIKIGNIIKKEDKYIDLQVDGLQYNLRLRFNWGNNNGVANPRWKFTFINK